MRVYLDFETASAVDLTVTGLDNYIAHPTTRPLLAVLAYDKYTRLWCGEDVPFYTGNPATTISLIDALDILKKADTVVCHNAGFDRDIAKKFWHYEIPLEKISCTLTRCASEGLPLSLGKAAIALGLLNRKNNSALMKQASSLNEDGSLQIHQESLLELAQYCMQDISVTRELDSRLPELSKSERTIWEMDYAINRRGVLFDKDLAEKLRAIVMDEEKKLLKEFALATEGRVNSPRQIEMFRLWLAENHIHVDSVAKDVLDNLNLAEAPLAVRIALEIRRSLRKSSTAKLETMLRTASADNRIREMFQYHGAATGRFSGRGVQPHNLPRASLGDFFDSAAKAVREDPTGVALEVIGGPIFETASKMIRGLFIASAGKTFLVGDFAQIEARVLPWLAGQENTLRAFRDGVELYKLAASGIYKKDIGAITKDERQVGKVAILACGYQGGWKAFESMGKSYDVHVPEDQAREIVHAWREANPKIVALWGALDHAAKEAVAHPGISQTVGRLAFCVKKNRLLMRLPSGRFLVYQDPKIKKGDFSDQLEYSAVYESGYGRTTLYGGLLAENATQAVARDILTDAMLRLENIGFKIVLHVHDEIVCEEEIGGASLQVFKECMEERPFWATGCPINVDAWSGERYKK